MRKWNKELRSRYKIYVAVMLVVSLVWGVLPTPVKAASFTINQSPEELKELTDLLTKELFELSWELEWVAREKASLLEEMAELETQLMEQDSELLELIAEAELKRHNLAIWLKFAFINTRGVFYHILFQAQSIGDLVIYWHLLERVISYQANLISEVLAVRDGIENHRLSLQELKDENIAKLAQLSALENQLIALTAGRQQALEVAQLAEQDYGISVIAHEETWNQLVKSLEELLAVFQTLEWELLEPRRLQLNLVQRRVVAEFGVEDIIKVVHRNKGGAQFQLEITGEGMVFTKHQDKSISFLAELAVKGNYLWLQPKAIAIDRVELTPELVEKLVYGYNLSAPLPEVEPGVVANNVWVQNGAVMVEFRLNL